MKCPKCGSEQIHVINSRPSKGEIRRRRECISCARRFWTVEIHEETVEEQEKEILKLREKLDAVMDIITSRS